MIFPLHTHVHVPAGVHHWDAAWDAAGKCVEVEFPVIEEEFNGIIVRVIDHGREWEVDLRPGGSHTKIEDIETGKTFMFLDSTIDGKITRL